MSNREDNAAKDGIEATHHSRTDPVEGGDSDEEDDSLHASDVSQDANQVHMEVDEAEAESYWVPDPPDHEQKDGDASMMRESMNAQIEGAFVDEADITDEYEEEVVVLDESETPQPGADLTSAFFAELSSAQEISRKRRRRSGPSSHRGGEIGEVDGSTDSDDEYGLQQRRAFHIPSHVIANFDPSAEPTSAEEYLLKVRMEADACPHVKRSEIDSAKYSHRQTPYMPQLTKAHRPSNLACLPKPDWVNKFCHEFAEARQSLICFAAQNSQLKRACMRIGLPTKNNYAEWLKYCIGATKLANASISNNSATASPSPSTASSSLPTSSSSSSSFRPNCPSLALLVQLDQVECIGILNHLLEFGVEMIDREERRWMKKQTNNETKSNSAAKNIQTEANNFANADHHIDDNRHEDGDEDNGVDAAGDVYGDAANDCIKLSVPIPFSARSLSSPSSSSPFLCFPFHLHAYTLWVYSLLLKVDPPISDSLAANLRQCYRSLSWVRAVSNEPTCEAVKYSNIIMTLCQQFGQRVEMMT